MANSNSTEKYKGPKARHVHTFTPSDYERPRSIGWSRAKTGKSYARMKDNPKVKESPFQAWKKGWQQVSGGPCAYHSYYGTKARSCSAVGKRQLPVASSAAGINQLFYIDDTSSKRRFLKDTR